MAETLSWRLAPVSTTKRERLARLPGGLSLLPACPYLCGVLARFFSSHRSGRTLGIHRLPSPAHPAALSGVVLDHPLHQLLEEAHAPPSLETLVDHALEETPNHSRCRAFHWHPVHNTYQMALMTARSEALGLPPRGVLFFLCLGRHFLSFLHRGLGRRK